MFSTRSASVKPRSRLSPCRTLSPSSSIVCAPIACSFCSRRLAIVDLPAPDSPVNHSTAGWWPFSSARCLGPTARSCQWMLVARRSAKSIMPAAAVSCVMRSIRMKPPVVAVLRVRVERERRAGREIAEADLVQLQRARRGMRAGVDVDPVLERGDRGRHRPCADLQPVGAARERAGRPSSRRDARRTGRRIRVGASRRHQHVAARDVDLVRQGQGHRVAGAARASSPSNVTISLTRDARDEPMTRIASPGATVAGRDRAGKAAEFVVRAVDPLHREAERLAGGVFGRRRSFRDIRAGSAPRYQGMRGERSVTLSP